MVLRMSPKDFLQLWSFQVKCHNMNSAYSCKLWQNPSCAWLKDDVSGWWSYNSWTQFWVHCWYQPTKTYVNPRFCPDIIGRLRWLHWGGFIYCFSKLLWMTRRFRMIQKVFSVEKLRSCGMRSKYQYRFTFGMCLSMKLHFWVTCIHIHKYKKGPKLSRGSKKLVLLFDDLYHYLSHLVITVLRNITWISSPMYY